VTDADIDRALDACEPDSLALHPADIADDDPGSTGAPAAITAEPDATLLQITAAVGALQGRRSYLEAYA
jgi:hypothetical protein